MTTLAPRTQRYWEDVAAGDELAGYSLRLDWTKMAAQVSGSQDFYPVHHDPGFARAAGHPDIFYNTGFTRAALCRLLTDWAGPAGWVQRLAFEMRKMNIPDDVLTVRGVVTATRDAEAGLGEADVDVWIENERLGITTPGTATIRLPKRG